MSRDVVIRKRLEPSRHLVGVHDVVRQRAAGEDAAVIRAFEAAEQGDAEIRKNAQVKISAPGVHHRERAIQVGRIAQILRPLVPVPAVTQPSDQLPTAVEPRVAAHPTGRQVDPSASDCKVF